MDNDGDGHLPLAGGGDDCDDLDGNRYPGNAEVCDPDGHDEDCDVSTVGDRDNDGDGYIDAACRNWMDGEQVQGDDCNDARADAHPGLPEVCDGIDNNCDGGIDEGKLVGLYPDNDGDQFGDSRAQAVGMCMAQAFRFPYDPISQRYSLYNTDCNDAEPRMNPGAPEVTDNLDNDCNGTVDDVRR